MGLIDFTFTCLMIGSEIMIGNPNKMVPMSGPFVFEKVEIVPEINQEINEEIVPFMTIRRAEDSKLELIMDLPESLHQSNVSEILMYCEDMTTS